MYYRPVIAFSCFAIYLTSCSDDSEKTNQTPTGLAAPRFKYTAGPAGRAVGVRAIVAVDGVELKSEPVEVVLTTEEAMRSAESARKSIATQNKSSINWYNRLSPNGSKRRILGLDPTQSNTQTCPSPGSTVDSIGTVNGAVCYLSVTTAAGAVGTEKAHTSTLIFGREGLYGMRSIGGNIYVPPDFIHVSSMQGIGCVFGDQTGTISSEYLQSLESISVSYSLFFYALGYSVFTSPGLGLVRAIQYDSGYSASVSMLPFPFSFGVSVQTDSSTIQAPTFLRPWKNGCGSSVASENPIQYFRDSVETLQTTGETESLDDALVTEIAAGVLPILDSLGTTGSGGLAQNVPAASNGDMYAEFLSAPGSDLPDSATNTSIDGQLLNFKETVGSAGDDTDSVVHAVGVNQKSVENAIPSQTGQAALQRDAEPGVAAASYLTTSLLESSTSTQRFISPKVVHVDVASGEKARIEITAKEIAELVNYEAADVMNATVIINAGTDVKDVAFTLTDNPLVLELELTADSLLVQIDVDLSTAVGSFPSDVANWVVRPAMRLVKVNAGKAATALLSAPTQILSGAPASLNVQVVDAEGRLVKRPYTVRFIDAAGNEIGDATPKYGTALLQYVPQPSVPIIASVTETQLTYDNATVNGIKLTGNGFSKDSEVFLGSSSTPVSAELISIESPELLLVVLPNEIADGELSVAVRNPGNQSSAPQKVQITGQ
jgi:hypothetical protein